MKKYTWLCACLILTFASPFYGAKSLSIQSVKEKQLQNKSVSSVQFKLLKGGTLDLSRFQGKVIVVNFFATWCPPCRMEIPHLIEFNKKWSSTVQVIGVSVDENIGEVGPFVSRTAINYPVALTDPKLDTVFGSVNAIPTTFIIDKKLSIVARIQGYVDEKTLAAKIAPFLK